MRLNAELTLPESGRTIPKSDPPESDPTFPESDSCPFPGSDPPFPESESPYSGIRAAISGIRASYIHTFPESNPHFRESQSPSFRNQAFLIRHPISWIRAPHFSGLFRCSGHMHGLRLRSSGWNLQCDLHDYGLVNDHEWPFIQHGLSTNISWTWHGTAWHRYHTYAFVPYRLASNHTTNGYTQLLTIVTISLGQRTVLYKRVPYHGVHTISISTLL